MKSMRRPLPPNRHAFVDLIRSLKYHGEFKGSPWDLDEIAKMVTLHRRQPAHTPPMQDLRKAAEVLLEDHPELAYAVMDAALTLNGMAPTAPVAEDDPDVVADLDPVASYVYTLWCDRRPVYVGMSSSVVNRLASHAQNKPWWPIVTRVQVEGPYRTKAAAYRAEVERINRLKPEHNKAVHAVAGRDAFKNSHETGGSPGVPERMNPSGATHARMAAARRGEW